MITGIIGVENFPFLEGNLEPEKFKFREVTMPYERGRAYTREAQRTSVANIVTETDVLLLQDRQDTLRRYFNMIGNSYVVQKWIGSNFEVYPGVWFVVNIKDVTSKPWVPLGAGGLQSGRYIVQCQWTLAHVDKD